MILRKLVQAGILLCLAAAVAAAGSSTVDISYLLNNTGAQGTSAFGLPDEHWTVDGGTAYVTDLSGGQFPLPYWLAVNAGDPSAWISPSPAYPDYGSDAEDTTFDFQTTFDLTGYAPASTSIFFRYTDDNELTAVMINGTPVIFASGAGMQAWSGYTRISGDGLFNSGLNTLDFFVYNSAGTLGNPTGLRVELSGEVVPEPGSLALIGSGILLFGGLLRRKLVR
jgi:hypothetical protein